MIVRQSLAIYAEALRQATLDVQTATDELEKAKAERDKQSIDSAQSSKEQQAQVETLRRQLADSKATLSAAQQLYDSKMAEYQAAVTAAAEAALALERERDLWRGVAVVLAAVAAGLGLWVAVK